MIRNALRRSAAYDLLRPLRHRVDVVRWRRGGSVGPPPHLVKREIVRSAAKTTGYRTLVETGTFLGDMVAGVRDAFDRVVTIELDALLAARARRRFRRDPGITVREGDSAAILPDVLATLTAPAVCWLDAHYSGGATARGDVDTPVEAELRAVLSSPYPHVVLIDDARAFTGVHGYPTLDAVRQFVLAHAPQYRVVVCDDVIRLMP